MKKIGIILIVLIMALASCSKDDDNTNPLVGTWVTSYTELGIVYLDQVTFKSDNTATVINYENGIQIDTFSFTWSTNNNILTVTSDGDTVSSVYAISGDKLTVDNEVYTRK